MTTLVLQLQDRTLEVQSDRIGLHYTISDNDLRVYIPENPRQQRICRRSKLPGMLATIIGCNSAASDDISAILSCPIIDLDDIMLERDINIVPWIERPVLDLAELQEDERSDTLVDNDDQHRTNSVGSGEHATDDGLIVQSSSSRQRMVSVGPGRLSNGHVTAESEPEESVAVRMEQYCKLLDQLFACAHGREDITNHVFRSLDTFGYPGVDSFEYNRRIGAAGEAYVRLFHNIRISDCRTDFMHRSLSCFQHYTFRIFRAETGKARFEAQSRSTHVMPIYMVGKVKRPQILYILIDTAL